MINKFLIVSILFACSLFAQEQRCVAFTFDDLPYATDIKDINIHERIIKSISGTLKEYSVPSTGFIIGQKIANNGVLNPAYIPILKTWLNAGLDLGNHSFSHNSLHTTPIAEYENDFLKCDSIIRPVITGNGGTLKYYRYPYLQTGKDISLKNNFEKFLEANKYKNAPVTIDNSDWIFARAYEKAFLVKDSAMMKTVADTFVVYLRNYFLYYEEQSNKIFGRNIKHILLLHANLLHTDNLQKVITMLKELNYKFITVDEALTDSAYTHYDTFAKNGGISWLHRWAYSEGKRGEFYKGEPHTPEFIMKYAEVDSE
jgi:peptidoglycan/xylan/chitin deacetylase (PgdA/CDA1 family)